MRNVIERNDEAKNAQTEQNNAVGGMGLLGSKKLTVPQAARAMGIGETKFRELLRMGQIPVIRILGKILILEVDLENYLRENYGALKQAVTKPTNKLQPLPEHIKNSHLLRKAS